MISGAEYDVIVQGIRALFFITVPILLAVSIIGTVVASIQAATTIQEPALGYTARVCALAVVLYLLFPAFARTCMNLAELAFH
jgi:type III secretory pathway component EscS